MAPMPVAIASGPASAVPKLLVKAKPVIGGSTAIRTVGAFKDKVPVWPSLVDGVAFYPAETVELPKFEVRA